MQQSAIIAAINDICEIDYVMYFFNFGANCILSAHVRNAIWKVLINGLCIVHLYVLEQK